MFVDVTEVKVCVYLGPERNVWQGSEMGRIFLFTRGIIILRSYYIAQINFRVIVHFAVREIN